MAVRVAVQPVRIKFAALFVGGRAGDAIAVAEPVEQVAIAAALAAEGLVRGRRRSAAQRAGVAVALKGGRSGHGPPIWRAQGPTARQLSHRCVWRALPASPRAPR